MEKKPLKQKIKLWFKATVQFILNPRLFLCFGIAWLITNGWVYIALGLATWLNINWLKAVASAYLAFVWFPFTPEKLITIVIAIFFLKLLFPNDKRTLRRLTLLKKRIKRATDKTIEKYKTKRNEKNNKK